MTHTKLVQSIRAQTDKIYLNISVRFNRFKRLMIYSGQHQKIDEYKDQTEFQMVWA